jgi:hypothetical protein
MAEVSFNNVLQPAPACYPPDINALLQLIAGGGITGTVPDNAGGGAYVGSAAPPDSLTNKVWFKIDAAGRPLGVYMFYSGHWRKVYTGLAIGEIRMFWYPTSAFDGTGRGVIGGDMDGWALCNGNNGTPNFQDSRFPCGGWWNGSSWVAWDPPAGAWQWAGGQGQLGHKLVGHDLPGMHVTNTLFGTSGAPCGYNLTDGASSGGPCGSIQNQVRDGTETPVGTGQVALPLPNYFAIGFLMFVGYT